MKKELTNIPAILAALWRMKRRKPTFMSFNVSNRCNEQCLMCNLWRTKSDELSPAEMERIFHDLRQFGIKVLEISGGEPFLRKDIFTILDLVDRSGFLYTLSSNGTMLDGAIANRLSRLPNLLQLAVSIDSLDRETYRKLRGADMLPRVQRNLAAVLERNPEFPVKINFTMSRFNYRETLSLLDYAEELGIFLSVFPVNQGPGFLHRSDETGLAASDEERRDMAALFRKLAHLRRQGAPLWDFSRFYELAADYVLGKPVGLCDAGSLYLDLHSDGIVAPCIELEGFADLRRENIADVYHRLEERSDRIVSCSSTSPCCYTCTYHVSITASHLAAYALETMRIRGLRVLRPGRKKARAAGKNYRLNVAALREDDGWNISVR